MSSLNTTVTFFLQEDNASEGTAILFDFLRQGDPLEADRRLLQLVEEIKTHPLLSEKLANTLVALVDEVNLYPAFVQLGIFSRTGLIKETVSRLYNRLNPPPVNDQHIADLFAQFINRDDKIWMESISSKSWVKLFAVILKQNDVLLSQASERIKAECLYALEMLSIWVAAEELDPELLRIDQRLASMDSPFIALQREVHDFVESATAIVEMDSEKEDLDLSHLWVMLEQSQEQVMRFRRRGGANLGSSIDASFTIERLDQTLQRMAMLLHLLKPTANMAIKVRVGVKLWQELLIAVSEKKSVKAVWKKSTRLLARSVTENKSNHGEHYISKDVTSYFKLIASAAGAGIVIAMMALLKIQIETLGLAAFTQTVLVSLNYGLGFVFIHLLHFTIATKQPAMTAATFASEVERNAKGRARSRKLAQLLVDVNRSQWAAVWGNVFTALLTTAIICWAVMNFFSTPLLSTEQITYQLKAISPFSSLALLYAAIAGVWLFCSGIIAGVFDNRADYLELNKRLKQHRLLQFMKESTRNKFADYVHEHYGALAGNFFFGLLLGGTGYLGYLLGLPLDIRHVAFSSANLGYASFSDFQSIWVFLFGLVCVLLIGFVNLWVSFSLALAVALRSRNSQLNLKDLLLAVKKELGSNPLRFFFPIVLTKKAHAQEKAE